ncbi:MAG: peptide ABC transporter substrate-binding protein [Phycisphaerales bacterium]
MRPIILVIVVLGALLGITVAADRPLPPAELTLINPTAFITTDPQRQSYNHDIRLSYAIGETLVRWDNESPDFDIVPALARSWTLSDDQRTYTFKLDPRAKWSNGDPVVADHLIYSWKRGVEPELVADYATMFFNIRNAKAYFDRRTEQLERFAGLDEAGVRSELEAMGLPADGSARERGARLAQAYRDASDAWFRDHVGLSAPDDHTLVVTLERPVTYFLDLVAFAVFTPVYPPLVEAHVTLDPTTGRRVTDFSWTKPPKIVTNGAYRIAQWKFKRGMYLERNPHYRAPELVKSDTIKIVPIEDENTAVLAFENGAFDYHTDVRVEYVPELIEAVEAGRRDDFHAFGTFGTYFWNFNCTPTLSDGRPNPFRDAAVRRAFSMSVDREQIATQVRRSGEPPAYTLVPPGSIPGFDSPPGLRFDPERARAELASAGWGARNSDGVPVNDEGDEFPVVELLVSTAGYHQDIAQAMGAMWREHLGVKTEIDAKETKIYRADLKARDYMLARGGWFGDYGDPTTFHYLHRTGDGNNDRGYSDPYFDGLMDRADNETDPEKRMEILEEAERYTMMETVPVMPIFHYAWYYLYTPPTTSDGSPNPGGLRGISKHPRLVQYLWKLEVVKDDEGDAS